MLAYDQPINQPKPDAATAEPRPAKSFSVIDLIAAIVAAQGRDRSSRGADLRLHGGDDRQEPDAALCRDRAALRRTPE